MKREKEKNMFFIFFTLRSTEKQEQFAHEKWLRVIDYRRLIGLHLNDELVRGHDTVLQHQSGRDSIVTYWF